MNDFGQLRTEKNRCCCLRFVSCDPPVFRESSQARRGRLNYHFTQESDDFVLVSKQARASGTAQVPEGGIRLFP